MIIEQVSIYGYAGVLLSLNGLLEFLLLERKEEEKEEEECRCRCCCIRRNSRMVE